MEDRTYQQGRQGYRWGCQQRRWQCRYMWGYPWFFSGNSKGRYCLMGFPQHNTGNILQRTSDLCNPLLARWRGFSIHERFPPGLLFTSYKLLIYIINYYTGCFKSLAWISFFNNFVSICLSKPDSVKYYYTNAMDTKLLTK